MRLSTDLELFSYTLSYSLCFCPGLYYIPSVIIFICRNLISVILKYKVISPPSQSLSLFDHSVIGCAYTLIYSSALAAIIKYHQLDGLNNKSVFSHSSEGWKSHIKVPASVVPGATSLPGLQTTIFFLHTHKA